MEVCVDSVQSAINAEKGGNPKILVDKDGLSLFWVLSSDQNSLFVLGSTAMSIIASLMIVTSRVRVSCRVNRLEPSFCLCVCVSTLTAEPFDLSHLFVVCVCVIAL